MITLNSFLNAENLNLKKEEFDQVTLLRDAALRETGDIGSMVLTTCRHICSKKCLENDLKTNKSNEQKDIYAGNEDACPVCRMPFNIAFPIFSSDLFQALGTNKSLPTSGSDYQASIKDLLGLLSSISNSSLSSSPILSKDTYDREILVKVLSLHTPDIDKIFSEIMTNFILFTDKYEKATGKQVKEFPSGEEMMKRCFVEMLRYIDFYGLAPAVKDFSTIYHNIYLSMRCGYLELCFVDQVSSEGNIIDRSEVLKKTIKERSLRIGSALMRCCMKRTEFLESDLEKVYAGVLIELVRL